MPNAGNTAKKEKKRSKGEWVVLGLNSYINFKPDPIKQKPRQSTG